MGDLSKQVKLCTIITIKINALYDWLCTQIFTTFSQYQTATQISCPLEISAEILVPIVCSPM